MKTKLTALERLNWRGVPVAYVSPDGARRLPRQGSSTYHDIFCRVPIGVRYAVAESGDRFFVFDLWQTKETKEIPENQRFIPEEHVDVYDDLDLAIGKTVMSYNDTGLLSRWMPPLVVAIWKAWRDRCA